MGTGEIEGLGRGDARDQAVGDLGRGGQRRCVLVAVEDEIAMDLVGNQDQAVLGAELSERTKLRRRPDGSTGIVRTAKENGFGARRQLRAQRIEIHRVAPLRLDQLRIENAPVVRQDDLAEGVIGGRKDDHVISRHAHRLEDQPEPERFRRRAHPAGIHLQAVAARHPIRSAAAQLPVSA